MSRSKPFLWAAALLAFTFCLYVWGLGRIPFYTKGEPREAVQVWEETHGGEWVLPMRNGHDLPSNPPLFHWLAGIASLAFGEVDEFSVRFPSAALATLSVLLVFWLGTKKWGMGAGLLAAFALATNFGWMRAATTARVDMTLTAFLVAAFVALDRLVSAAAPAPVTLAAFYISTALATLAKGPVGMLLPALVAITYLALRGDLARLKEMRVLAGGAAAVSLAGVWYVLAVAHGGKALVYKQLWVENVGRVVAAGASGPGHEHSFFYMIGGFLTGFAPWSFFAIPLGIHLYANRRRLDAVGYLYPIVWFAVVFVFYSVAASQRTVQLLPLYPAAALLLGAWWSRIAAEPDAAPPLLVRVLQTVATVLALVSVAAVLVLLAAGLGADSLGALRPLLRPNDQANLSLLESLLRDRLPSLVLFVAALVPMLVVWLSSVRHKNWSLLFAALVAFVATGEAIVSTIFEPALAEQRSFKPFMDSIRGVVEDTDTLSFYRAFDYGAVFYARRHITPLREGFGAASAPNARAYVLLWKSQWDQLPPEERGRLQHLLTSVGTGPKGRDALVFGLVKPVPTPAPSTKTDSQVP